MESVSSAKKVGYLFFGNLGHALPKQFKTVLSNGASFSLGVPKIDDEVWEKWLGLEWESVTKANAVLEVEMPTSNPSILDGENKLLTDLVTHAWIALKLTGPFYVESVRFATGSNVDGKSGIRQTHKERCVSTQRPHIRNLSEADVSLWSSILDGLTFVYSKLREKQFIRFNRGLLCFQKGWAEDFADFRVPMFVRALEALVLPDQGDTRKQFSQRVAQWWPKEFASEDGRTALREIYDIRCNFDHLHGLQEAYPEAQMHRFYQAEAAAREAFQRVLLDRQQLERFASDESIRAYWNRPESQSTKPKQTSVLSAA